MRTTYLALVALSLFAGSNVFGQSLIVVSGEENQVVVVNSQNVTRIDARQWHVTDARQWHRTTVEIERPAPQPVYVIPVVVAIVDDSDCREVRLCVKLSCCGRSFTTIIGGEKIKFDLIDGRGYSAVAADYRGRSFTMTGRLWKGSVDRLWYFTSKCPDGIVRTWRDP